MLDRIAGGPDLQHLGLVRAEEAVIPAGGIPEAGGQILPDIPQTVKEVVVQPEDDPLVGLDGRDDLRTVDITVVGQQDIAWAELVGAPLDDVVDIPGDEEVDLIKCVLVEVDMQQVIIAIMMVLIKCSAMIWRCVKSSLYIFDRKLPSFC